MAAGPGLRSTSEILMHIVNANYGLLNYSSPAAPVYLTSPDEEETMTAKPDVIDRLRHSLDAVKTARASLKPGDLQRHVQIHGHDISVDSVYLRIIIQTSELMGQLEAYARVNGIVPPRSALHALLNANRKPVSGSSGMDHRAGRIGSPHS
jgi:hypothetical protein